MSLDFWTFGESVTVVDSVFVFLLQLIHEQYAVWCCSISKKIVLCMMLDLGKLANNVEFKNLD